MAASDADDPGDQRPLGTPILVWGEAIRGYDFGPGHPLTPRRFGPGIDLVRAMGAERILEPPVASDVQLERLHTRRYIGEIRAFSADPDRTPAVGVGPGGDCPSFEGMHEASARVAGGSLAGVAEILAGRAERAFNPAGGLHHAMAGRASGFCIYNDVALAVAAARDAGHRVLYVDLDVHHGDGTQALFWDDPTVLTLSIHESGRSLFPGSGWVDERGGPAAPGSAVNVPLEAMSGDASWLVAVESVVPAIADGFRPTMLVTQHGCDSHAFDPLANLRVTTRAYARACALLDEVSRRWCDGRWMATGGGGYDAYRVVPRSWAMVWLAQAGHPIPEETPAGWRARWEAEAARFGQAPMSVAFLDPAELAAPEPAGITERNARVVEGVLDRVALGGW